MKLSSQSIASSCMLIAAALFVMMQCMHACTNAFQLSMVASSRPPRVTFPSSVRPQRQTTSTPKTGGITSGLISNLAVVALKLRLREQSTITCDVTASSSDLLWNGQVGPVTVRGKGWKSPLGLTCRAIDATVDTCDLDMGRILSHRKLVLTTPAKGSAMVALDSSDFGNFITHPLMKPPGLTTANGETNEGIRFERDGVQIDASTGKITFCGSYLDGRWQCTLQRGSRAEQRALVSVTPHSDDSNNELRAISQELTHVVSDFFNEMIFELDGTFLTFRDMQLTERGGVPSVMLALGITVRKFPSPGLAF